MRSLLKLSSLFILSAVVGCHHTHSCTTGVCDCDITPLATYGHCQQPGCGHPAPASVVAPAPAMKSVEAPKEMPKVVSETVDK